MKSHIFVLLSIIISFSLDAQNNYTHSKDIYKYVFSVKTTKETAKIKRADDLYNRLLYIDAAKQYEKIKRSKYKSPKVIISLANSYYHMKNIKQALKNYQTVELKHYKEQDLYNYLQVAKMTYNKELSEHISTFLCDHFDNKICYETLGDTNTIYFEVKSININTSKNNDFGAYPINEREILFLSDRSNEWGRKRNGYNKNGFYNIYQAKKQSNDTYSPAKRLHGSTNSKYNEGSFCFSPNGKYVYFTRNAKKNKDQEIRHLAIYVAEVSQKGKWKKARSLSINTSKYSNAHPTLSVDGTKMIFASSAPNGYGGTDLYIADVLQNGEVVSAINLGNVINTERNEVFPYIDKEGNLYFSSDGHNGFGGLDVFFATMKDQTPLKIMNCGVNINSPQDDFAIILNEDQQTGYLSSNRKGTDNIYALQRIQKPGQNISVKGMLNCSDTKTPIYSADIELQTDNLTLKINTQSDILGYFSFTIPDSSANYSQKYQLTIKKTGFQTIKLNLNKFVADTIINIELDKIIMEESLEKDNIIDNVINNIIDTSSPQLTKEEIAIYFDRGSAQIREENEADLHKIVDMLNEHPTMMIEAAAHTDCSSSQNFNIKLSKRRANAAVKYIRDRIYNTKQIYGKGYGETRPIIDCNCRIDTDKPCSDEDLQINRRVEFIIKRW